jgi:organic hydroperoxide reductase OsmC/OhrA
MAKALGGKGDAGKTNPEELFAAGYGEHSTFMDIEA